MNRSKQIKAVLLDNTRSHYAVKRMVEACERTGRFEFNSRYFLNVGEWEIAFRGVYRFLKGNEALRETFEPEFSLLAEKLFSESDLERLPLYDWTEQ